MSPLDPEARARDAARRAMLDDAMRERMAAGEHELLARELASENPALAAWILEQVWDFEGATRLYVLAGEPVEALRTALESGQSASLDARVDALAEAGGERARAGAALLSARRRHDAAARLLAAADDSPEARAQALSRAGDRCAAAEVWLEAEAPRAALDALGELDEKHQSSDGPRAWALAARAWWMLGDAQATAHAAQAGLRGLQLAPAQADTQASPQTRELDAQLRATGAEALRALGHPIASQVLLDLASPEGGEALARAQASVTAVGGHGRYRVLGAHIAPLAGSAYLALDRVTHEEVEVHLLLADQMEGEAPDPQSLAAVRRFLDRALTATRTPHPSLRGILRSEAADGLVVLPRARGSALRTQIRPPGLAANPERARAFILFLAEGLSHVHRLGFAHGGVFPSMIFTDALGRPQLGPAGADLLSGLAATRTGGLEELLRLTSPEQRRGEAATPASDIYALGGIWLGLLTGRLDASLDELDAFCRPQIEAMLAEDPASRPTADTLVEGLRRPVRDLREVRGPRERLAPGDSGLGQMHEVDAHETIIEASHRWTLEELDAICRASSPWIQTVTRRDQRVLWLADWPEGCSRLTPEHDPLADLDPRTFEALDDAVAAKLRAAIRARPQGVVRTPSGECLVALDGLLADEAGD